MYNLCFIHIQTLFLQNYNEFPREIMFQTSISTISCDFLFSKIKKIIFKPIIERRNKTKESSIITKHTVESNRNDNDKCEWTKIAETLFLFTPRYIFTILPRFPLDLDQSPEDLSKTDTKRAKDSIKSVAGREIGVWRGCQINRGWYVALFIRRNTVGNRPGYTLRFRCISRPTITFAGKLELAGFLFLTLLCLLFRFVFIFSRTSNCDNDISRLNSTRNFSPVAINFARERNRGWGREGAEGGGRCAWKWMERETVAKETWTTAPWARSWPLSIHASVFFIHE